MKGGWGLHAAERLRTPLFSIFHTRSLALEAPRWVPACPPPGPRSRPPLNQRLGRNQWPQPATGLKDPARPRMAPCLSVPKTAPLNPMLPANPSSRQAPQASELSQPQTPSWPAAQSSGLTTAPVQSFCEHSSRLMKSSYKHNSS